MWTIEELKNKAKQNLTKNYWSIFVVILLSAAASSLSIPFGVILLAYPIEVGMKKYILNSINDRHEFEDLWYAFKFNYLNTLLVQFLRYLFIMLWSFLFLIPGIIKSYEYKMIPYILAEDPNISFEEAKNKSSDMTMGHKMDMFILDLSFIGWILIGSLCVIGIFFVNPYIEATNAELYLKLKENTPEIIY